MNKNLSKDKLAIIVIIALTLALGAFSLFDGGDVATTGTDDPNQALTGQKNIVKREINLEVTGESEVCTVGETFELSVNSILPFEFSIDDPEIASVDENGIVTCNSLGETTLRIIAQGNGTYDGDTYEIPLLVQGLEQTISGVEDSYTLNKDEELQMEATATTKIKYKSNDTSILTVDKNGVVHGVSGGIATLQVIAVSDGTYAEVVKEVAFEVTNYTVEDRNRMAIDAAIEWAKEIADDNSFHYGRSSWAHHHGCYFCGTNQAKNSEKRKAGGSLAAVSKTYCCNPFVTAAFCHGAGAPEVDCKDSHKRINLANDPNPALNNKDAFERVQKPSSIDQLQKGDVLLTPTHAMLYAGDGMVLEAAHHDNGKKDAYWDDSIRYAKLSAKQWKRTSKIYRYIGTGKF